MPGKRHYWNEDTQSWEDSSDRRSAARPPTSAASDGVGHRVLWIAVSAAAVVAVVTTAVFVRLPDGEKSDHAASQATPSMNPPPGGYRLVDDKKGFSVAVPQKWKRDTPGGDPRGTFEIDYDDPDTNSESYLRITDEPGSTPKESIDTGWEGHKVFTPARSFKEKHASGYIKEYLSDDGESTIVEVFLKAEDGNVYGVTAFGASEDLSRQKRVAKTAMRHFCPPDTQCGT